MSTKGTFRLASSVILALGVGVFLYCHRDRPTPTVTALTALTVNSEKSSQPEALPPPGAVFTLDVAALAPQLDELREDERGEQIADWVMYGVLFHAGLSAQDLRAALYDKTPIRDPALEETLNFDYGPGRRVILQNGEVWLFYSEFDAAQRIPILGRLADQARMELGGAPPRFCVFRFHSDLARGVIQVQREEDLSPEMVFSERFGYVERDITSRADFEAWLSAVDDVTHVELPVRGMLRLGGRRFSEARTAHAELDDVAALYQAQRDIAEKQKFVDQEIDQAEAPLRMAFNDLIQEYNTHSGLLIGSAKTTFQGKVRAVETLLSPDKPSPLVSVRAGLLTNLLAATGDSSPGAAEDELNRLLRGARRRSTLGSSFGAVGGNTEGGTIDRLRPQVETRLKELGQEVYWRLYKEGKVPPAEPGFSLDPQWDTAGLLVDLDSLLTGPEPLLRKAHGIVKAAQDQTYLTNAMPLRLSRARQFMDALDESESVPNLPKSMASRLRGIQKAVQGKTGKELEDGAILPFLQLREELKGGGKTNQLWLSAIDFLEALHRSQSARYDGNLRGTRVGMVLFYTDLLAKLWASLDYYGEAPTEQVFGFLSDPRISPGLEPEFWKETWRLPATRLWFGIKKEAYSAASDRELDFAHIATRVYSAGRNPLNPGEETTTAEASRRVFGWWDHHFARVADYEPMYHLQNQIMKWSVLAGWLQEQGACGYLNDVPVAHTHRFDHWYRDTKELRFHHPITFEPEQRWFNGTETITILSSYEFPSAGVPSAYIYGGVSLGSARSVAAGSRISSKLPFALRRGGLDYAQSSAERLRALKGSEFTLPRAARSGRLDVEIRPPKAARFRSGPATFQVENLSLRMSAQSGRGTVAIDSTAGEIGQLHFQRSAKGTKLDWNQGSLARDHDLARKMLREYRFSPPAQAESKLAGREAFLPDQGVYLVSDEQGFAVALSPKTSSSGGGSPPSWRELHLTDGSKLEPGAWLSHSEVRLASLEDMFALVAKQDQPIVRVVEEPLSGGQAVAQRLNSARWQRLKPLADKPSGTAPGRVERLFTAEGPAQRDVPIEIETGSPQMPTLKGYVADGAVYLERLANGNPTLFNDLVTSEAIRSQTLTELIQRAQPGSSPFRFRLPAPAVSDPGTHAVQAAAQGDQRAVLHQMVEAARQGNLDQAIQGFHREAYQDGWTRLVSGEVNPVARRMTLDLQTPKSPDDWLLEAMLRLDDMQINATLKAVKQAVQQGPIDDATARLADGVARERGQAALADYLLLSRGRYAGVGREMMPRIDLVPDGHALHTLLKCPPGSIAPSARACPTPDAAFRYGSVRRGQRSAGQTGLGREARPDAQPVAHRSEGDLDRSVLGRPRPVSAQQDSVG